MYIKKNLKPFKLKINVYIFSFKETINEKRVLTLAPSALVSSFK